jgi:hypothetical protein
MSTSNRRNFYRSTNGSLFNHKIARLNFRAKHVLPTPHNLSHDRSRKVRVAATLRYLSQVIADSVLANEHQCCRFGIIDVVGNRSIPDPIDSFVDHEQRYKEPFTRDYSVSKAIFDLYIHPRRLKNAVNKVFVQALASRQQYPSHGSVIDADEAARLGLSVTKLGPNDELWQRLWLLRCMYAHDARRAGALKIFEGPNVSNRLRAA